MKKYLVKNKIYKELSEEDRVMIDYELIDYIQTS